MNDKMISCKTCGKEIAKSAKKCPSCGAKTKKKNPIIIGIIVVIVLICIVGSTGGDDTPQKIDTNTSGNATTKNDTNTSDNVAIKNDKVEEKTEFSVGETADLKGVSTCLVRVSESTGSAYNKPTDGNVFLICEFEIANNSKEEIAVSSMMSFEAYCDDYTCTLSLSALMEKGDKNQLDGTVAPGKKFNGVIGYEVPENWKNLEIRFTPNFWSGKDIVFVVNK